MVVYFCTTGSSTLYKCVENQQTQEVLDSCSWFILKASAMYCKFSQTKRKLRSWLIDLLFFLHAIGHAIILHGLYKMKCYHYCIDCLPVWWLCVCGHWCICFCYAASYTRSVILDLLCSTNIIVINKYNTNIEFKKQLACDLVLRQNSNPRHHFYNLQS